MYFIHVGKQKELLIE